MDLFGSVFSYAVQVFTDLEPLLALYGAYHLVRYIAEHGRSK